MNSAVIYVDNVNEYIQIIDIFDDLYSQEQSWIFRGQKRSSWKLETLLERFAQKRKEITISYRKHKLKGKRNSTLFKDYIVSNLNEYKEIQRFKQRTEKIYLSNIAALSMMQHYGAPTRLLDFSMSLGIALYFAFEKEDDLKYSKWSDPYYSEDNRAIWCVNKTAILRAYMQTNIAFNDFLKSKGKNVNEVNWDKEWLDYALLFSEYCSTPGIEQSCLAEADRYITYDNAIENRREGMIIPVPLIGTSDRINIQDGIFLFPTRLDIPFKKCLVNTLKSISRTKRLSLSSLENDRKIISVSKFKEKIDKGGIYDIVKLVFPSGKRDDFLKLCSSFNIVTSTIYPDIYGAASCVNYNIP